MTPEERAKEVMEYARQQPDGGDPDFDAGITAFVLEHIYEAVTEEREACAKLADNAQLEDEGHWQAREIAERVAAAIRKRGEQPAVEVRGAG